MPNPTLSTPRIQTQYTRALKYQLAAMTDSIGNNFTLGVGAMNFWPERLGDALRRLGCFVEIANHGRSGNTTANTSPNALYRFAAMLQKKTPTIGVLQLGVNDPGNGISTAQTTANLQAMVKWLKFGCLGVVAGQANLPAYGVEGDRYVVLADTSTTGGLAASSQCTWQATTLTGTVSGSGQAVWEYRLGAAGESGWGRIAIASTTPTHVSKIIVLGAHYLNFSSAYTAGSGRDTTSTPYVTYDASTGVRKAQIDAAANEGVVYADFYGYLRGLAVAAAGVGINAAGSAGWHVADGNQHGNAYFQRLATEFMLTTIQAQSGWMTALRAA